MGHTTRGLALVLLALACVSVADQGLPVTDLSGSSVEQPRFLSKYCISRLASLGKKVTDLETRITTLSTHVQSDSLRLWLDPKNKYKNTVDIQKRARKKEAQVNLDLQAVTAARDVVSATQVAVKNAVGQLNRRVADGAHDGALKHLKRLQMRLNRHTKVDPPKRVSQAQKQAWSKFKQKHITKDNALTDPKLDNLTVPAGARKAQDAEWAKVKDELMTPGAPMPSRMGEGTDKEVVSQDPKSGWEKHALKKLIKSKSNSELVKDLKDHVNKAKPLESRLNDMKMQDLESPPEKKSVPELVQSLKAHMDLAGPLQNKLKGMQSKDAIDGKSTNDLVKMLQSHLKKGTTMTHQIGILRARNMQKHQDSIDEAKRLKRSASLGVRLKQLQGIEKSLDTHRKQLQKNLEGFGSDGPAVRLKLHLDRLKQETAQDAWGTYEQRHRMSQLATPRKASQGERADALKSLSQFSKTGSVDDLVVAASKEIPDMASMAAVQTEFAGHLRRLAIDFAENKRLNIAAKKNLERAELAESKHRICKEEVVQHKVLEGQLKKKYYRHSSLEINAKWEFKDFETRKKRKKLKLHKRYAMAGIKGGLLSPEGPRTQKLEKTSVTVKAPPLTKPPRGNSTNSGNSSSLAPATSLPEVVMMV